MTKKFRMRFFLVTNKSYLKRSLIMFIFVVKLKYKLNGRYYDFFLNK